MDTGNMAWLLVSSALVMLMTPGLGFFYGGLSKSKNILTLLMQCFAILCVVSVTWILWGYSLAFGDSISGYLGWSTSYLAGVSDAEGLVFVIFQMMFAIITPALIVGAMGDRIKFSSLIAFVVLWSALVYSPVAHWVWGGGWLSTLGSGAALDFAGGTVVHINAGFAALVAVYVIGNRKGVDTTKEDTPSNVPYVILGTALLWFGWFGFNAGSALAADGIAAGAFLATNTAAAAAALTMMFITWKKNGKPSIVMTAVGAVAGLVAITPAAGFVTAPASIVIGVGVSVISWFCIDLRRKRGLDDALDVWAVHGMGGLWGALATGIFASIGATGLLGGNSAQFVSQIIAVVATIVYTSVLTFIILKVIDQVLGLRVSDADEKTGLDESIFGEKAFSE
ncbi:MAG: ammonium transporter [Thermoproteota archaeon]